MAIGQQIIAADPQLRTDFLNGFLVGLAGDFDVGFVAHDGIFVPCGADYLLALYPTFPVATARISDISGAGIGATCFHRFGWETDVLIRALRQDVPRRADPEHEESGHRPRATVLHARPKR